MIAPDAVRPFDNDAISWIANQEAEIDKKLAEDKAWEHHYTSAQHPERWANLARRYHQMGWAVVVEIVADGHYTLAIKHPALALPRELTYTRPTTSGRR